MQHPFVYSFIQFTRQGTHAGQIFTVMIEKGILNALELSRADINSLLQRQITRGNRLCQLAVNLPQWLAYLQRGLLCTHTREYQRVDFMGLSFGVLLNQLATRPRLLQHLQEVRAITLQLVRTNPADQPHILQRIRTLP